MAGKGGGREGVEGTALDKRRPLGLSIRTLQEDPLKQRRRAPVAKSAGELDMR
jgi:hypothetical protein